MHNIQLKIYRHRVSSNFNKPSETCQFYLSPSFTAYGFCKRKAETYRKHLREIGKCDFGDADGGFWHVVRYNGWTEQLTIADWREMNVQYDAVVYGQTHKL